MKIALARWPPLVATEDGREARADPEPLQDLPGEPARLVGVDGEDAAGAGEQRLHPLEERGPVEAVALVVLPPLGERRLEQVELRVDGPRQEVARSLADEAPKLGEGPRWQSDGSEGVVHRAGQVRERIHQRAVQVEDGHPDRVGAHFSAPSPAWRMVNSTRRFLARPRASALEATGRSKP
jgi:hypothetical protein